MNYPQIIKVSSALILMLCLFMIIPVVVALWYGENSMIMHFLNPAGGAALILALALKLTWKTGNETLTIRDGFLLVTMSWIIAALIGSFPFWTSGAIPTFTDAYFETMSGFTTTGASVLTEIESLPRCLLFWRSLTHWLGGMGIVVLTVALLPILGAGGVHMLKAEAPGPTVDKTMPRIADTAKTLWIVYLAFTAVQTILLMFGGMDLFDSLTHTFGTLATGGFSPKNLSVGHYNSAYIDWVITAFMVMAGINFALYFKALSKGFAEAFRNTELKVYLAIFGIISIVMAMNLNSNGVYSGFFTSLRYSAFQTASILTTTGYATANYDIWPEFAKILLFLVMFVGGCSGSTGGGIKVIRILALFKMVWHEMKFMAHPRGIFKLRIDGTALQKNFIYPVAAFFFLYIMALLFTTLVVASAGYDILTSFSTSLATLGNIGPGFAMVGPTMNYQFFPDYVIWFLSFVMLLGRLELYTVLILLTGKFWK
ncbi:MAG: potassium transporter [Candidatus Wallbacteria bacterium HGW-Wallbacteria-1]|jgi:trk system potassium uptake protein TrkH|uniref:Potassium transporter n=1 Tax=Candidatus Wallbacteria bacterium HGW-Wallbacteria-1 TaxID=2013854 RepID=A0A2N1PKL6_9BACT|nr:MAG: potassium transporter [Candidatus Wallbacteria bacterium HGW-Wallbacteria-1]